MTRNSKTTVIHAASVKSKYRTDNHNNIMHVLTCELYIINWFKHVMVNRIGGSKG